MKLQIFLFTQAKADIYYYWIQLVFIKQFSTMAEYQFSIKFTSITFEKLIVTGSTFKTTLYLSSNELSSNSIDFKTHEIVISKTSKTASLNDIPVINLIANALNKSEKILVKYSLGKKVEQKIGSFSIYLSKIILDVQKMRKHNFKCSNSCQGDTIQYELKVEKIEKDYSPFLKENQKGSTPISASKEEHQNGDNFLPLGTTISVEYDRQEKSIFASPSPAMTDGLDFTHAEKKASQFMIHFSEIKGESKSQDNQSHSHTDEFPLKMKVVIVLFLLGIFFLIFDTLGDRTINKSKIKNKKVEKKKKGRS